MVSGLLSAPGAARARRGGALVLMLATLVPVGALADVIVPDPVEVPASIPASALPVAPPSEPGPTAAAGSAPGSAAGAGSTAGAAATSTVDGAPSVAGLASFEKAERLEALRYRHLWIAYSMIWLVVFAFAWRTWKRTGETGRELAALKTRLDELEGRAGRGEG